jgi:dihydrofolate reductase
MRKLILGLAVSLDGYIEGPNGEYDWCFTDQDYGLSEFHKRIDAIFIGRKTYEMAQAIGDPGGNFQNRKVYVFSSTLEKVKEGETLISDHLQEQVEKIKKEKGKDIWLFGGAALTSSLLNMGLIDEIWLSMHPVILGGGKPLFTGIKHRVDLHLAESKTYATGLVSLKYTLAND